MTDLLSAALAFAQAGCSVVPARNDGTKAPAAFWTQYMTAAADGDQLVGWFAGERPEFDGFGLVCGAVSGNLELLEWEGRAVTEGLLQAWLIAMSDHGLAPLAEKLMTGYLERTPSGGLHILYRVDGTALPNTKLARRPSTPIELAQHPDAKIQTLMETRGQGGYVVVAPSAGRTVDTTTAAPGGTWQLLVGTPDTIPVLTETERDDLHAITRLLDAMPDLAVSNSPVATSAGPSTSADVGARPGDDYNARATWEEILIPRGWTKLRGLADGAQGWQRPGKKGDGISATTGRNEADNLFVFSSSTEFPTEVAISKFEAFTLLEHAGDHAAAARALRLTGFGGKDSTGLSQLAGLISSAGLVEDVLAAQNRIATAGSSTDGALALAPVTSLDSKRSAASPRTQGTRTDVGNAEALVARHGENIRYVARRGMWLVWEGARWRWDHLGRVVELAKDTVDHLPSSDDEAFKHRIRSMSRGALSAMVGLAETDPGVAIDVEDLDANPFALCTPTGVVDLRTGATGPSRPEDLHTRSTTVPLDPAMATPRWEAFLADTFGGDAEMIGYVQRLAGYSCTGSVTHHSLPFLHGSGGNGKSVFLDVVSRVLGDYAGSAPAKFLMAGADRHETEIARLAGMRFVICSEVNQQDRFDEAKIKLLTGGDTLTARFLNQDHFDFIPSHHLWLMGNHQPRVEAGGESFWRRLRLVPFAYTVPEEKKVDGLTQLLLEEEGSGILAWLVRGAVAAMTGLAEPARVLAATRTYALEEDALARFMADRCQIGGGHLVKVETSLVRFQYERWCRDEGETVLSSQVFGREMKSRFGVDSVKSNGKRFYLSLTMVAEPDRSPEPSSTRRDLQ